MKAERIVFNVSTYGALAVALGILAFPAITSLAQVYSNGALSSPPVSEISLVNFWGHVFLNSDPGAMMSMGRGALTMLIFIASLLWLSVARLHSKYGPIVVGGVSASLIWASLSAYFSVCSYESLLDVCSYASVAALFFLISSLIKEFSLQESGAKAECVARGAERTAGFALNFLQIIVFCVMVGAWGLYFCNPASDGISGSFYNKNIFAAFLLMIAPCGLLRLAEACRELESTKGNCALAKVCAQSLFTISTISLIILTYSRSCLVLLCLVLVAWAVLFAYLSDKKISQRSAILFGGSIAILLLASVFLWTRLFSLALACIVAAFVLTCSKLFRGRSGGRTLATVCGVCLALICGIVSFVQVDTMADKGAQHLQELGSSRDSSLASRYQFYKASLKIALAHPILGIGSGNFERFYPAFQTDFRWFSKRSHSLSCDLLAEGGVLSFVIFYLLAFFIFWDIFKKLPEDTPRLRIFRLSCALGALVLLLHSQVDIDNHVFVLPLWGVTLLGIAWGIPSKAELAENSCADGWSIGKRYFIGSNCVPVIILVMAFCLAGQAWGGQYYSTIGKIYLDMGEVEKARQCYSWASEYDPKIGEYWRQMAVLTLNQCDSEERAKSLAQSIRFCAVQAASADPHRASVQSILGQAFEICNDLPKAELSYKRSLELDNKNSPDSYANLARVYTRQGRIKEAENVLENAFSTFNEELLTSDDLFDFRYKDIKNQLISCCLQRFELALFENNEKNAEQYLQKACRLEQSLPNSLQEAAVYLLEQGRHLNASGRKQEARAALSKAKCFLSVVKTFKPEDKEVEALMQLIETPAPKK